MFLIKKQSLPKSKQGLANTAQDMVKKSCPSAARNARMLKMSRKRPTIMDVRQPYFISFFEIPQLRDFGDFTKSYNPDAA